MRAYLLTWNPNKFDWAEAEPLAPPSRLAEQSLRGKKIELYWSCARSHQPKRDDRIFLTKLGKHGRGVFASGWITRGSHASEDPKYGPQSVDVDCDVFLDPGHPKNLMDPTAISGQVWTPQSSGIEIRPAAHLQLETMWLAHIGGLKRKVNAVVSGGTTGEEPLELEAVEGESRVRLVQHRHRESVLRRAKLLDTKRRFGGLSCEVCNFNFERTYGIEYAEVHHLKPLGKRSNAEVTTLKELAVLCANCHRVAHSESTKTRGIAEMRKMLRRRLRVS